MGPPSVPQHALMGSLMGSVRVTRRHGGRVLMQFETSMQRKAIEDLTRTPAAAAAAGEAGAAGGNRGLQPDYVQVQSASNKCRCSPRLIKCRCIVVENQWQADSVRVGQGNERGKILTRRVYESK